MGDRIAITLKLICIFYLVVFIPRLISFYNDSKVRKCVARNKVSLGIESFSRNEQMYRSLKNMNFALVVEQTSCDQGGSRSIDVLVEKGFAINKIGCLRSCNATGFIHFDNQKRVDPKSKIPLVDIIQTTFAREHENFFEGVGGVIVDLHASGMRFDANMSLLFDIMDMAAQNKKKVIVTDRVNPLGACMEGPGDIPLRHGLTLGELALYYNKHILKDEVDLDVIPMKGWNRADPLGGIAVKCEEYDHSFERGVFDLLREVQPLEVAQGENHSQALIFPENKQLSAWEFGFLEKLCDKCGFATSDCSYWDEERGQLCKGLKLLAKDDSIEYSTFNTLLTLVRFLSNRKNIKLSYSSMFDDIIGCKEVRNYLQGRVHFKKLKKNIDKNVEQFYEKTQNCFLYKPFPKRGQVLLVKN